MPLAPKYPFEIVPWGYGWGVRLASEFSIPFKFADSLDEAVTMAMGPCRRTGQHRVAVLDRLGNTVEVKTVAA